MCFFKSTFVQEVTKFSFDWNVSEKAYGTFNKESWAEWIKRFFKEMKGKKTFSWTSDPRVLGDWLILGFLWSFFGFILSIWRLLVLCGNPPWCSTSVLVVGCWLLNHVIFLKPGQKILNFFCLFFHTKITSVIFLMGLSVIIPCSFSLESLSQNRLHQPPCFLFN